MKTARRTAISHDGWCYLFLVAAVLTWAILREANLLLIVAGMLLGPLVSSAWLVGLGLRQIAVRRKMPRAIYAGDPLLVEIELSNSRRRLGSWAVTVADHIYRENDSQGRRPLRPATFFSYLPAGSSRRRVYRDSLPGRGRYRFGPLEVSTRFPFGLVRQTIRIDEPATLTVYPRLGQLGPAWRAQRREALQGERGGGRPGRAPGDFCGVREWQRGDSVRWVHWRSTARHGGVVVCQFEQPQDRGLAVLVDLWQPGSPEADDPENVELAVSFAATLVAEACRRGAAHLVLGITAPEPDVMAGCPSAVLMEHAMGRLAVARASDEDRLPALLHEATRRSKPRTEVLLVSTRRSVPSDLLPLGASRIRVVSTADADFGQHFQYA